MHLDDDTIKPQWGGLDATCVSAVALTAPDRQTIDGALTSLVVNHSHVVMCGPGAFTNVITKCQDEKNWELAHKWWDKILCLKGCSRQGELMAASIDDTGCVELWRDYGCRGR